jgi:hypothetical protein
VLVRYGEVIQRSLSIYWRHRYLWLLGALGGGESVGGGFGNFGVSGQGPAGSTETGTGSMPGQLSDELGRWFYADLGLLAVLTGVLVLFLLAYFFLSCLTAGATVRAAAEHDAERPFDLGAAWRAGRRTFLPILGLRLLGLLLVLPAVAIMVGLVGLGTLSALQGSGDGVATAILAGIVVLPAFGVAAVVLGVIWTLATRAIVLEQIGVGQALRRGFDQLRTRFGRVALLWLIAIGIGILSGLLAGLLAGIFLLPFLVALAATYAAAGVDEALTAGALLLLVYIVGVVLLNGAVGSFLTTYWTLAFRRLELDPEPTGVAPGVAV